MPPATERTAVAGSELWTGVLNSTFGGIANIGKAIQNGKFIPALESTGHRH